MHKRFRAGAGLAKLPQLLSCLQAALARWPLARNPRPATPLAYTLHPRRTGSGPPTLLTTRLWPTRRSRATCQPAWRWCTCPAARSCARRTSSRWRVRAASPRWGEPRHEAPGQVAPGGKAASVRREGHVGRLGANWPCGESPTRTLFPNPPSNTYTHTHNAGPNERWQSTSQRRSNTRHVEIHGPCPFAAVSPGALQASR